MPDTPNVPEFPLIAPLGLGGWLVRFGDRPDDAANRAALSFRAAIDAANWKEVAETATALASVFVSFDPMVTAADALRHKLAMLLAERDWMGQGLPAGRRRWTIPCAFGGASGPALNDVAQQVGLSADEAITALTQTPVRVLTLGFAPGQPYLGTLPPEWDIPRQKTLTPMVPAGALVVAVRQLIVFTASTPTGWQHIGQTSFACFRPDSDSAFPLRAGDEVVFRAVSVTDLPPFGGDGGAICEDLP
ncbi:allophanate hydrolase subunit 1 [Rhodobacteraceae bacterium SC52]|nr:allophanate hydrolase subunit 1 [Rhodobacteraceae bacterium SC52]